MKLKLKLVAAALAVAATAGVAQARIQDGVFTDPLYGSEFVFSAWDANAGRGYTYDLEWEARLDTFAGADPSPISNYPTGAVVMSPSYFDSMRNEHVFFDRALPGFGSDFLGNVTLADVRWNLAAADSVSRKRVLTTLGDITNTVSNIKVSDMAGNFNKYVGAVNGFGSHFGTPIAYDGWATTVDSDGTAYAGNAPTWANTLGATCNFAGCDTSTSLGQANDLYMFFQKSTSSLHTPGGLVQLAWNGHNTYAVVYEGDDGYHLRIAAVPEPSSYALLLAGLGLLGFMARRRLGN